MQVITVSVVAKYVTDVLDNLFSHWTKNLPAWAMHLIVAAVTVGVMFAWSAISHLPFDWSATVQASLGAVGFNEAMNAANPPSNPPSAPKPA